jgi:hypothetical protein
MKPDPNARAGVGRRGRLLLAAIACVPLLILAACSPEDAAAPKAAAAALERRVNVALNMYADLIVRADFEPPMSQENLIQGIVRQALTDSGQSASWHPDQARLRGQLADVDPRDKARATFKSETKQITDVVGDIESAAADYEAAWPLGSEQFVCLKQGVFKLARNLREVARSFDPDATTKKRYLPLKIDSLTALDRYDAAVRKPDGVIAATALLGFRDVMRAEAKANEDVQAAFVQAAQSAADLYAAIESVENVTLTDILKIVQRYAPGLTRLDDSIDGAAIAKSAGVALGKIQKSDDWLTRFADQPIPSASVKCRQT